MSTVLEANEVIPNKLPASAIISDTAVMAKRNLLKIKRIPQLLVFSTIQPVMFVLLFRYVFGGAISSNALPGGMRYVDYLIPGIMVQTVTFGGSASAIGLAADIQSGILDRFRSLPMTRSAVLVGRTIADSIRSFFVVLLMIAVGSAVGFRFHNGFLPGAAAVALAVLFAFAMAWLFAFVGMSVKDPETAQVAGFLPVFPLVFLSGAFTPTSVLPKWLAAVARNQPLAHVVSSIRGLTQGGPVARDLIPALLWIAGIVAVFAFLSVRKYRRV